MLAAPQFRAAGKAKFPPDIGAQLIAISSGIEEPKR